MNIFVRMFRVHSTMQYKAYFYHKSVSTISSHIVLFKRDLFKTKQLSLTTISVISYDITLSTLAQLSFQLLHLCVCYEM